MEPTDSALENTNSAFENTDSAFENTDGALENTNGALENTDSALENKTIVGIDLGTTNSVVAAVVNGQAKILHDETHEALLPSVVALDSDNTLIVGHKARNGQAAFPERTVSSIKRRMGEAVQVNLGEQTFSPHEISAMILRRLKSIAEASLQRPVTEAVITVPAFFDENQRQATREAGHLAGLNVARIINEPTAAALAYQSRDGARELIAVYDLGGGTFDVSIVRMEQDVVEVLSSQGDTHLGGDDFDQLLADFVADRFQREHDIDLRANVGTRWRLIQACEMAKRELSTNAVVRVAQEFIAEKDEIPLNLDVEVTRVDYEDLIHLLVERTISCVDQAIRDANVEMADLTKVILVGGSTRTPCVQNRLRAEFGLEPMRAVDPDLSVALGAATQGAKLSGQDVGPVLIDVASHTLGIAAVGETGQLEFSPIIHRGSPLPASHEESYWSSYPGQDRAKIKVYQGESLDLSRNSKLGSFYLYWDTGDDSQNSILVKFSLTLDGVLRVVAKERASGNVEELQIDNALSEMRAGKGADAEARLLRLYGDSAGMTSLQPSPTPVPTAASSEVDAESMIESISSPPEDDVEDMPEGLAELSEKVREALPKATAEDESELKELLDRLKSALDKEDMDEIAEIRDELEDILFYVNS